MIVLGGVYVLVYVEVLILIKFIANRSKGQTRCRTEQRQRHPAIVVHRPYHTARQIAQIHPIVAIAAVNRAKVRGIVRISRAICQSIVEESKRVIACVAPQIVLPCAHEEQVVVVAAEDEIVARTIVQRIIAVAAIHGIMAIAAFERVIAAEAF
ncbi:hypothetical protein CU103_14395 [Phyllobacterium sophorae]|uniref:Uncharacterized protein n=1 Tax=Phyllobacterium sophorae TaxID=1520277 RepID=A0A2P7BAE8_9HYPH|nr:hypothetical protein CU103_14395 [Phyllobacterium sophorae]